MKHLNFLSNLLSLSLGSPCTDVSLDRRLTVGSPSGGYVSGLLKLVTVLVLILTIGVGNAWGAESVVYTLNTDTTGGSNGYATLSEDISITNHDKKIVWNAVGNTTLSPWRIGGKKITSEVRPVYSETAISENITKVVVSYGEHFDLTSASAVLKVYSTAADAASGSASNLISTVSGNDGGKTPSNAIAASATHTFTRPAGHDWKGRYFRFEFSCTYTPNSNKYFELSSADFYADATTPTLTVSGNATSLAVGDAKVNGSGETNSTLTFSGANLSANATLAISGTNASMFSVSPASVTPSTGTITNQTITVTYTPTSAGNHTATLTISSTGATSKEITLTGTGKYEVTWRCAGSDDVTTLVASGSRPTFPSSPTSCDGTSTTFYGWTASTWSGKIDDISAKTIHTSNSTMSTVTANGTVYHAVFAKGATSGDYIKGTKADLTEGQTVLIINNNSRKALSSELDGDGYCLASSVSFSSSKITSPASALIWTVELGGSGGYYFKHGSKYINAYYDSSEDTHHLYYDSYTDEWTLTGSGPYVLNSTEDSGYKLYYWSTYSCWDTYTGTGNPYNTDFYIPEITYSKYLTNCCTELGSINGSFF